MEKDWRPGERKSEPTERPADKPVRKERFETYEAPARGQAPSLPRWWWIPLAALAALLLIIFFAGNDEPEAAPVVETQTDETATLQARLTSCEQALAAQPEQETEACAGLTEGAYQALRRDLDSYRKQATEAQELADDQENIIADAARRICCAQRVENNAINAYDLDGNKIICVSSGGTPISC
jgi:hypothetical protein